MVKRDGRERSGCLLPAGLRELGFARKLGLSDSGIPDMGTAPWVNVLGVSLRVAPRDRSFDSADSPLIGFVHLSAAGFVATPRGRVAPLASTGLLASPVPAEARLDQLRVDRVYWILRLCEG